MLRDRHRRLNGTFWKRRRWTSELPHTREQRWAWFGLHSTGSLHTRALDWWYVGLTPWMEFVAMIVHVTAQLCRSLGFFSRSLLPHDLWTTLRPIHSCGLEVQVPEATTSLYPRLRRMLFPKGVRIQSPCCVSGYSWITRNDCLCGGCWEKRGLADPKKGGTPAVSPVSGPTETQPRARGSKAVAKACSRGADAQAELEALRIP